MVNVIGLIVSIWLLINILMTIMFMLEDRNRKFKIITYIILPIPILIFYIVDKIKVDIFYKK